MVWNLVPKTDAERAALALRIAKRREADKRVDAERARIAAQGGWDL